MLLSPLISSKVYQSGLGHIRRQQEFLDLNPYFFRPLAGSPLIGQVGWVLPHPHNRQSGHDARLFQQGPVLFDLLADRLGHRPAFQQYCHVTFLPFS